MKKAGNIIQWGFFGLFVLMTFVTGIHISSLFLLTAAVLIAPLKPIRSRLSKVNIKSWAAILLAVILFFTGITISPQLKTPDNPDNGISTSATLSDGNLYENSISSTSGIQEADSETTLRTDSTSEPLSEEPSSKIQSDSVSEPLSSSALSIPAYSGSAYVKINNNIPFFTPDELKTTGYENYSPLDSLGRCGTALACVGKDTMPKSGEERGSISNIKPTGWVQATYENISGKYLYNRCHLIGWQLSAENANRKNLITGTKYMNVSGMLPFENMVADYIKETGNHVAYRITPVFEGNNLLASGVQIEAYSVEDSGEGIRFNVYCYNVQPGIIINYKTGASTGPGNSSAEESSEHKKTEPHQATGATVYRTPTGKRYHLISTCGGKNSYKVTLREAKAAGLTPCQKCAQ